MPATWDISRERRLLLHVIEVTNPKPPSWPAVAEKMGEGFTAEACRQHYNKIKRETKGTVTSKPKGTKAITATTKPTSKKRKVADTGDDDEVKEPPQKAPKARKFSNDADGNGIVFKAESDDPNEAIVVDGQDSLYE